MKRKPILILIGFMLAALFIVVLWGGLRPSTPPVPPGEITNEIGCTFIRIPPGTFLMGSHDGESDRKDDERQHQVRLTTGFFMSVSPVTWRQWNALMPTPPLLRLPRRDPDWPVESVSWDDCQEFIRRLRAKDEKPYRLPTEAEWEYACRAGTTTAYSCGNFLAAKDANFGKFRKGATPLSTSPAGRYPPNPWGLLDMHGNVWEWCQDWYGAYPEGDVVDPTGPMTGSERVLRGGAYPDDARFCRSAARHKFSPTGNDQTVGFRLAFTDEGNRPK